MRIVGGVIVRAALCGLALAAIPRRSTTAAEVAKIGPEHARRLPGGKEVDAIHGDYLLRSDRIVATIGGVGAIREANVNTQAVQGAVLDLARRDLPGGAPGEGQAGDQDLPRAGWAELPADLAGPLLPGRDRRRGRRLPAGQALDDREDVS